MPFRSQNQRKYLEMLKHNPKKVKEEGKSDKDMESINKFVDESEQMPQPKIEKVKPRFSKTMSKIGKK